MPEYRVVETEREPLPIEQVEELLNKQRGPERIIYGLDVGRVKDYSTLAILVRHLMPTPTEARLVMTRYYTVYLHRYELLTPYEVIEEDAARWWHWGSLTGIRQHFVMDMTGVGAPVWEAIKRRRVRVEGVTITGGVRESNPSPGVWDVPKATLVTQLVRTAQSGRFKGYDSLKHWKDLADELGTFGYKMNTETNTVIYESLSDKVHDDLVMAVALCIWYGERVVPYRGLSNIQADVDNDYNPLA